MKKKILFHLMMTGLLSTIFFTIVTMTAMKNYGGSLYTIFKSQTTDLSIQVRELIDYNKKKNFQVLKDNFIKKNKERITLESLTLKPLVDEFSIFGVRNVLQSNFDNDLSIESASLVVIDQNTFQLWQFISREYPRGLNLQSEYDRSSGKWSGNYDGKQVQVSTTFLDTNGAPIKEPVLSEIDIDSPNGFIRIIQPIVVKKKVRAVLAYDLSLATLYKTIQEEASNFEELQNKMESSFEMTRSQFSEEQQKSIVSLIIITLVFIVFFLIAVFFYSSAVGSRLALPIVKLKAGVERIRDGDYHVTATINSNDEIEDLGNHFNAMVRRIFERDEKIREYQNNLEQILEVRTRELEEERAKNIQQSKIRSMGEMAAGVAHEINNPISIIGPNISLIKKVLDKQKFEHPVVTKSLNVMDEMVDRIAAIIVNIKDFTGDQSVVAMSAFSLDDLLHTTLSVVEQKHRDTSIQFTVNRPEHECMLFGKRVALSQVLVNLIDNACYEVKKLQSPADRWVTLNINTEEDRILFEVENGGPRISSEILHKIMEPFYTTKEVGEGTGLGLSISSEIVRNHNGELIVNTEKTHTCFSFSLNRYTG